MNFIEVKNDDYNFSIILKYDESTTINIGKFSDQNIIRYNLPFYNEKEYYYILNCLANIFNIKNISPIYQREGIFEEEIYCFITNNILVKYYYDTEDISIEIKNDNEKEKNYDEIVMKITCDLYNKFNRGIKR